MILELAVLLALAVLGSASFAVFEVETPGWRKVLKWGVVTAATLALYSLVGHWSLLLPVVLGVAGLCFHLWWCRRHAIHPLRATPRRRYYELRGWQWVE
ncbi:MAG TPA: hypothetical protein VIP80_08455 [Gemmatimonadales bacterium]|jgi:hypothetical protein